MSRMIEGRNYDEWIDTSSHSERDIFNGCVEIMAGLVDDFKEWYLWMHGDDALDCISEDELFEIQYPTSKLIRRLFLSRTTHSGGTSCAVKREELGVDVDFIGFGFMEKDKNGK